MAQNVFLKEPAATKVRIVNEDGTEVLKAEIINLPLSAGGNLQVNVQGGTLNSVRPSTATLYCVYLDNILLLQSDGGFFAIPLNSQFLGIGQTQINNLLSSYKSAYSTLVSGVTAATLHYSKLTNTGVVTSEVYDLKAVD